MKILILTPGLDGALTGNVCSGEQWREILVGLGHEVELVGGVEGRVADLLVALNAEKSAGALADFQAANPAARSVVVLTGTDIYPALGAAALGAMRRAGRLVVLQQKAVEQVPVALRDKVRVIVQAAPPVAVCAGAAGGGGFQVAVIANLRAVKDPLLAAAAARLVAPGSKLRVRHAGAVLEERYRRLAEEEAAGNPRYEWLGSVGPAAARQLIAESDLLVLSSLAEGAGRVVGEAIAEGVPVLSTRIAGVVGLLGDGYPGLFPVGDAAALAELLQRAESDAKFMAHLRQCCRELAPQFAPERERAGWRELIDELR